MGANVVSNSPFLSLSPGCVLRYQMPPSLASEASSDGHTFVPLNEEAGAADRIAREHAASPRDILPLIAPALRHFSGSPLSRAGCVLLAS